MVYFGKRKRLDIFCDNFTACQECVLAARMPNHMCGHGYSFLDEGEGYMTPDEIDEHYEAAFGGVKPKTNGDRIRAMTDEELAEWLVGKTFYKESAWSEPSYLNFLTGRSEAYKDAVSGTREWLQQPAERSEPCRK